MSRGSEVNCDAGVRTASLPRSEWRGTNPHAPHLAPGKLQAGRAEACVSTRRRIAASRVRADAPPQRNRRIRNELSTTETLENAIAAAANMGLSLPIIASGIITTL